MKQTINDTNTITTDTTRSRNNNSSSSSRGVGPGGTSGTQACAACKHRRRKCAANCPLAPYFPAHESKQFLNVHGLFGVRNISDVLNITDPCHHEIAMKSMIAHANIRANDPVGGCHRIICQLQQQIENTKMELQLVLQYLTIFREQNHHPPPPIINFTTTTTTTTSSSSNNPNVVDYDQEGCNCYNNILLGYHVLDMETTSSTMMAHGGGGGKQDLLVAESEDIKPPLLMFHDDKQQTLIPSLDSKQPIHFRGNSVLTEVESKPNKGKDVF